MSKFQIKKATKEQSKLRMAIHGPSGSGKTFSALSIATHLGDRILVGDTETKSASKYGDKFNFDVFEFDGNYHPDRLCEFLRETENDYDVIVIDSGSHFWNGSGGFLELIDQEVKRMKAQGGKGDSFLAWKTVDPVYKRFVAAILNCKAHVIITLRAKQEYSKEGGKVTKLGLAPEMRDGFQYEMDVEGMLTIEHDLAIGKTRLESLDGKVFHKPGKDVANILTTWLNSGAAPAARESAQNPETIGDELVRKLNEATTMDEVSALKQDATQKRERLDDASKAAVRQALDSATTRLKAA